VRDVDSWVFCGGLRALSVGPCLYVEVGLRSVRRFVGGSTADVGFSVLAAVGALAAGDVSN
jgi:hypothetical protein